MSYMDLFGGCGCKLGFCFCFSSLWEKRKLKCGGRNEVDRRMRGPMRDRGECSLFGYPSLFTRESVNLTRKKEMTYVGL